MCDVSLLSIIFFFFFMVERFRMGKIYSFHGKDDCVKILLQSGTFSWSYGAEIFLVNKNAIFLGNIFLETKNASHTTIFLRFSSFKKHFIHNLFLYMAIIYITSFWLFFFWGGWIFFEGIFIVLKNIHLKYKYSEWATKNDSLIKKEFVHKMLFKWRKSDKNCGLWSLFLFKSNRPVHITLLKYKRVKAYYL